MGRSAPFRMRQIHRWGAAVAALPFLLVLVTGILLQFKKEAAWIQPPTLRGAGGPPSIGFEAILAAAAGVPAAAVRGWEDVERLDVRPDYGIVKVQAVNGVEVQVDTATGAVLQAMPRRSDLIEGLHDGSWFHERAKLWVFFPMALVLAALVGTGIYLWLLPIRRRRRPGRSRCPGNP